MLLFISFVAKDRKIVREWICMALLGKTEKIKIFFYRDCIVKNRIGQILSRRIA